MATNMSQDISDIKVFLDNISNHVDKMYDDYKKKNTPPSPVSPNLITPKSVWQTISTIHKSKYNKEVSTKSDGLVEVLYPFLKRFEELMEEANKNGNFNNKDKIFVQERGLLEKYVNLQALNYPNDTMFSNIQSDLNDLSSATNPSDYEDIQKKLQQILSDVEAYNQAIADNNKAITDTYKNDWHSCLSDVGKTFSQNMSGMVLGNVSFKDSMLNMFNDIKNSFIKMITDMIFETMKFKAKQSLINMSTQQTKLGAFATIARNFLGFDSGGIVPGSYSNSVPIIAHGSEMVLNPNQQKVLWNLVSENAAIQSQSQQLQPEEQNIVNNNYSYHPVFQSLDPAQGQKMFQEWMSKIGLPMVSEGIHYNRYHLRDLIRYS